MRRGTMACAMLATLASCGSPGTTVTRDAKGDTTVTMTGGPGGTMVTKVASGLTPIPTDLPAWAPGYPGAKVSQVTNVAVPGSGSQKMVVLMTPDAIPKVMAFYDGKIAALRLKPSLSAEQGEGSMRAVDTPGGQPQTLIVGTAEGQTAIAISYRASS